MGDLPWPRLLTADERQKLRPRQARLEQVVADGSGSVEVGWAWYERRPGVVAWGFRNRDSSQHSVILMRNSYYFGDAYWSIYSSNPSFRTQFLAGSLSPPPLADRTVPQNSPPLGLVQFDGFQNTIVCFIFTLPPGQTWAMLEGGFSAAPPSEMSIYDVEALSSGDFCVGYDPQAVRDWDEQTRTRLNAFTPNPSTFNTWLFQAQSYAPYKKLFSGDSAAMGRCAQAGFESAAPGQRLETSGMFPPVFPDVLSPPLNP